VKKKKTISIFGESNTRVLFKESRYFLLDINACFGANAMQHTMLLWLFIYRNISKIVFECFYKSFGWLPSRI